MRIRADCDSPAWQRDFDPPEPLDNPDLRLVPLGPPVVDADYQALMSCRERLVRELDWNQWPPEGFTLEDNREDLARHYAEFVNREAYAYSLFRGDWCFGCIYIEPWNTGAQLAFWVVDAALEREAEVVSRVLDWLSQWPFEQVIVPVKPDNLRGQQALAEAGLARCEGPQGHISFVR